MGGFVFSYFRREASKGDGVEPEVSLFIFTDIEPQA
jgi:hypothetical protein